jgi:diacylglycerol kinase (ATP)
MTSYLLIANPVSGAQAAPLAAERVRTLLAASGARVELHMTTGRGDALATARRAAGQGIDAVVVCGGDGTLQEVATALDGTGVPLGMIPRGRCNDFAHAFGLHRHDSPERLAEILLRGKVREVDLGAIGEKRFLTVATLGFDSEASRYVETHKLWVKGTPAYLYAVFRVLVNIRYPIVRLRGDFGVVEGPILLAATGNSPSYGGAMRITPHALLDDGLFHITVVEKVSRLTVLRVLPRVIKGTHLTHPAVKSFTSTFLEVETPGAATWICADGESIAQTPCRFTIRPKALRVLVP